MKKLLCVLISTIMVVSIFTSLPLASAAATKRVSLSKSSATLKITKKNGKSVFGTTAIKLSKIKGVKIVRTAYASTNRKVAVVDKSGKITARKKGTATIKVAVRFKYNNKVIKKKMNFKVTVKDLRSSGGTGEIVFPERPTEPAPIPFENSDARELNKLPVLSTGSTGTFSDKDFLEKLSEFSNKLYAMSAKNEKGNYTMSPVSVYMALAMLYSIGDDTVKSDIEALVNMNEAQFKKTGELFRSLIASRSSFDGVTTNKVHLTNSIWIDNNETADPDTLQMLADELYCSAYDAPFKDNNKAANQAVREFIKSQTNGLIDQDFDLQPSTLFALINTLYFKDIWSDEQTKLQTVRKDFKTPSGKKECEFLKGFYFPGKVQETDCSYYFFTKTNSGYKAKFVLPKDGYTLAEAMSAENLNKINAQTKFGEVDEDLTRHYTRCIFPSFKIESDTPLTEIFAENNLLQGVFNAFTSPLMDKILAVDEIKHRTVVDVTSEGIEGAAVTVVAVKAGAVMPTHPEVYHDFELNSSFGFLITDPSDVVLFEGQVTNPQ